MNARKLAAAVAAAAGLTALAACGATTTSGHVVAAQSATATAAAGATSAPPAPPAANPKGTYEGSCDYTLSTDYSGNGNDHLIGEIDLKNTGNVGVVVKTRITWPQEGALPITARKTVRLPFGASKPVRFSIPVSQSGNVITLLQSWQENHGLKDGCTYHAAFDAGDTFGAVH